MERTEEGQAKRCGRAEGLRMAAALLRDGELLEGAAAVLDRLAAEEEPEEAEYCE